MTITTRSVACSLQSSGSSIPRKEKTCASSTRKKKDDEQSTAPTTASRNTDSTTATQTTSTTPRSTTSRCDAPTTQALNKKAAAPKARSAGGLSSSIASGSSKGKSTMTTGTASSVAASSKTTKQCGVGGNKEATKIKAAPIKIVDLTADSPPVVATVQNKKSKKQPVPTKKGEVNIMPSFIDLTINGSGAKSCCVEKESGIALLPATTKSNKKVDNIAKDGGLDEELGNSGSYDGESSFELEDEMSIGNLNSTLHHHFEGAKDPIKYRHSIERVVGRLCRYSGALIAVAVK